MALLAQPSDPVRYLLIFSIIVLSLSIPQYLVRGHLQLGRASGRTHPAVHTQRPGQVRQHPGLISPKSPLRANPWPREEPVALDIRQLATENRCCRGGED